MMTVVLGMSLLAYLSWLAGEELASATRLVVRAGGLVLVGGLSLGLLYLVWGVAVVLLTIACRWMVELKHRRRDWWLRYI